MSTTVRLGPPNSPGAPGRPTPDRSPAPAGRRHGVAFWTVAGTFATITAFSAVPTPLYGLYAARDDFGALTITIVFAVYVVGVATGLMTAGHISDSYGRRRVLATALAVAAVSGVLFLLWRDLPGLIVARLINGLAIGATSSTATAWLTELHTARRPAASPRRAEIVAAAANLVGVGGGALVAGILAQWVTSPLTVPYLVFLGLMAAAAVGLAFAPETRVVAPADRPRYRPQKVQAPAQARGRFYAALTSGFVGFAALGFFTSLAPTFLAGPLGHPSLALAGAVSFLVTAAAAGAPIAMVRAGLATLTALGAAAMIVGTAAMTIAVELSAPSLWLFLVGGALIGVGFGGYFRSALTTVLGVSDPDNRAGALASLFLASYVGMAIPVVGLGVLVQHIAADTSLLIFGALLTAGVLASAWPMLHRQQPAGRAGAGDGGAIQPSAR